MLNFLKGKLQRWGSKQAKEELQYFVDMLEGADLEGRALTVALATDIRNKVINSDDFRSARTAGVSVPQLRQFYQQLQQAGMLPNAAGCAVCLHTERAMIDLTLMVVAKRMWKLLEQSFPYVEAAADGFELLTGLTLELRDYDQIPDGFRS